MLDIIEYITDSLKQKNLDANGKRVKRSSRWRKVRKQHLKENPQCFVCGSKKKLTVHHKILFSLDPNLELNPSNLITLCTSKIAGVNCHLHYGHLHSWKRFNPSVVTDAYTWRIKLGVYERNKDK